MHDEVGIFIIQWKYEKCLIFNNLIITFWLNKHAY